MTDRKTPKKEPPLTAKERAKRLYLEGDTLASVALKIGRSKRTVERWSSEGGWEALKNGMPGNSKFEKKAIALIESSEKKLNEVKTRVEVRSAVRETIEGVNTAINYLMDAIETQEAKAKSLEGCVSALAKLFELREKLQPKTAADLAKMAIELGLKPEDFATELRDQWDRISA